MPAAPRSLTAFFSPIHRKLLALSQLLVFSLAFALAPGLAARAQPAPGAAKPDVLFFAAASLQTALNAIAGEWKRETGKTVAFSYAASSALARQIEQGAPADLFASADLDWMDYAQSKGLIRETSRKTLLGNRLVLIAAKDDPVTITIAPGFDLAAALGAGKLVTGNPASVPVGKYAQAALTKLGVWDQVQPKIAGADNVRAALALVARGEAKLGIVYATDARAEPKVRVVDTFPAASHAPIAYPFALTKAAASPDAAAFLAYLGSPGAVRIFEAEGFSVAK